MLPDLNFINWLLAFLPIVSILVLMMVFRFSGGKAGSISWFLACGIALWIFGADQQLLAAASLKGLWTTVFILYIIWGAMTLYNVVDKVGAFDIIADTFTRLTGGNRILQLLTLGWAFPSFLQGVCGFGTCVAVASPLLVGLGFPPVLAAAAALLGHSWAVTFGSLGSSYAALVSITGLDPAGLAQWSSLFLAGACLLIGPAICLLYRGLAGLRQGLIASLAIGISMASTTLIIANFVSPYIASVLSGVVGMLVGGLILPRVPWYRPSEEPGEESAQEHGFHTAFAPYYILLLVVLGVYLTPLADALAPLQIGLPFPTTQTAFGFVTEGVQQYAPISVMTTPGTLIFLSVLLAVLYFKKVGMWKSGLGGEVFGSVLRQAVPATVTVMTMSMMAVVMMDSGMTTLLAEGTAEFTRSAYPIMAPFVGLLGAFMTGSNTSSNILFGAFQRDVAAILGASTWITASLQTAGAAVGNAVTPMNVALAAGVTGIVGQEGNIIRKSMGYTLFITLLLGLAGYLATYYFFVGVP